MPGKFRCCVCKDAKYLHEARHLSARKEYKILSMAGLLLSNEVDLATAKKLVQCPRPSKVCWDHSMQSLNNWLSCASSRHNCPDNTDCLLVQKGILNERQTKLVEQLEPESVRSFIVCNYISDERKAVAFRDEKLQCLRSGPVVKFVTAGEITEVSPGVSVKLEDPDEDIKPDVTQIDLPVSSTDRLPVQRKRKQNTAMVHDAGTEHHATSSNTNMTTSHRNSVRSESSTSHAHGHSSSHDVTERKRKDERCGTSDCGCCRFYQNEMKKMEMQLFALTQNFPNLSDPP